MSLRRSTPSIHRLTSIQGLLFRQFHTQSSPSLRPIGVSSFDSDKNQSFDLGNFLKWISGIAAGSGLGFLCWSSFSSPVSNFALADLSTESSEPGEQIRRFRSLFPKLSLPESSHKYIFREAFRRKIFFNYEKRIRLRSPPEKVFEYFASFRTPEGELFMRPADLMRAVVPVFPPSESHLVREGYLTGERRPGELHCSPSEFFMLFDVNNDGYISFKEYIFFVTLLSIPESSFTAAFKMFDVDNNGTIDKEEFKKVMAWMRARNRQGAQHRDGLRFGLRSHGSVDNGGLVEFFFGKDGNGRLQIDKFITFLRDLQDEIIKLEFAHYDFKERGTISATDFALSMVASADMRRLNHLLDRVANLKNEPHLKDTRFTYEEFKTFAELRKELQPLSFALFSYGKVNGLLTREDFQRAASNVCGISLADNVLEIIFYLFDTNCDGNLSLDEFIGVLHGREREIAQPVESGILGFLFGCGSRSNPSSPSFP